jgi:hypothetical protein
MASHRDVAATEMWRQVRDRGGDGGKSDSEGSRSGREEVVSVVAAAAAAVTEREADKGEWEDV